MARYTGPKTKIARKFGEPIFGEDKSFEKRNYPPGQHGNNRRRGKKSEYAIQLAEKLNIKVLSEALQSLPVQVFNEIGEKQFKAYKKKYFSCKKSLCTSQFQ